MKIKNIAAAGCVLFVLLIAAPGEILAANTYYVDDTNGIDSNPGTLAEPWKTLGWAAYMMDPGDTTYIRGGTYYETGQISPYFSGNAVDGYITFQNYQNETVTLDGTVAVNNDYQTRVFNLAGRSYIRVIGFRIVNYVFGISLDAAPGTPCAHHIEIRHCYIDVGDPIHDSGAGLFVRPGHDLIFADLEIYDCKNGIIVQGRGYDGDTMAYNVQVLDVNSYGHWGGDGDGVCIGNCSRDALISGCTGHDTQDDGIDVRGYNITIENCTTYGCTSNTDAHGIKCYGQDPYYGSVPDYYVRVVKCLSYNNYRGIFLSTLGAPPSPSRPSYRSKEIEVINCTAANNTYGVGFENWWDSYPLKPYVYNTISSSDTARALLYLQSEPVLTANYNLWWTQVPGLEPIDKFGTYYSSYLIENPYVPSSWFLATGSDEYSRSVDPCFVDADSSNFRINQNSPCVDAGIDVGLPYAGSAPDMGFYESGTVEVNCPANYLTTGENWISIPVAADNAQPYSVFADLGYWPNCVYHHLYRYNSPTAGFAEYPTYQSDAVQFGKITPGGAYKLILGGNQPTIHVSGIELNKTQTLTIGGSGTRDFYFGNPFNKTVHKNYCKISYNGNEVSIEQAITNGWIEDANHFDPATQSWEAIGNIIEKWNAYRLSAHNTSGELNLVIYYPPPGDLNSDGTVDWNDLKLMSDNWLRNDCSNKPTGALDDDCDVDFRDYAIFAKNWLE